ncbi:hypothetical protein WR25_06545 [Diploscapter pachys]|uniref:Uncharacterized protein n=1 Tax=Diploscapter pachys TaxID=2018661 RepID=A0A2A2LW44_9BILA|nr:hypothetical protein WR25_06545 [Diploscapter pachys]
MGNQVNRDFWDVHVEVTKKGDEMLTLFGQTIECFEKNTEPITCKQCHETLVAVPFARNYDAPSLRYIQVREHIVRKHMDFLRYECGLCHEFKTTDTGKVKEHHKENHQTRNDCKIVDNWTFEIDKEFCKQVRACFPTILKDVIEN